MELDEEELRRILDEGSATPTQGDELALLRADLAKQGESMTPSMGEAMPKGTKVVFAEETQAPVTPQSAAARMPTVPKVVDVSNQPTDDMEMAYARAQDRKAKSREAFERGTRELIAGLTRTQVAPTFKQDTDAVARLLGKRKAADSARLAENAQRLQASRFDYERQTGARKEAEAKAKDERDFAFRTEESARDNERAERGIDATNRLAQSNFAIRRDEADAKKQDRADKAAANEVSLFNETLALAPGLGESERSAARTEASKWNAADAATGVLETALQAYVANPSRETAAQVQATLAGASTALNTAFGQGAMAEAEARRMADTLGADLKSPAGVQALVESLMGNPNAGKLLMTKLRTAREGNRKIAKARVGTYGKAQGASRPSGPVKMRFPDGSVHEVAPDEIDLARRKGGTVTDG